MDFLVTLASLSTMAVAVAMTLIIVQYVKPLLPKIDTRLLCLVVALILTQIGAVFLGSGIERHIMAIFNAFIVATSAMGSYEVTFKSIDVAKKEEAAAAASEPTIPPNAGGPQ